MEFNNRLKNIALMVDKCESVIDVGTDHGYIPVYLIKNKICEKVIASDINKGPIEKAAFNIRLEGLTDFVECRRGSGLQPLEIGEVQGAVIAGMGGNLIRDIIEDSIDIFKGLSFAVLQPVQNPEVLRKYVYEKGFEVLDEELCFSEGKYYEILKVRYGNKPVVMSEFDYEISPIIRRKRHPLLVEFLNYKLKRYERIFELINNDSITTSERKEMIATRIKMVKELLECL